MTTTRIRARRHALAVAATLALGAWPAQPALAASCTWSTTAGNWAALANWASCVTGNGNPAGTPGSLDTATIGAPGIVTINTGQSVLNLNNAGQINIDAFGLNLVGGGSTANTGVINVGGASTANIGISAGHNINNTGGVINIAEGSVVNQFGSTITGGTVKATGTGALVSLSGSNFLSGVTLEGVAVTPGFGTLSITTSGSERVINGLTLNGADIVVANFFALAPQGNQTIGGTGRILLGFSAEGNLNVEAGNLVLGSGITVSGAAGGNGFIGRQNFVGGAATLTNNGTIAADVAGRTMTLGVAGTVTNNGTLTALNGGTLVLNNSIVGNVGSQITVGAGSTIVQNGVTLNGVITNAGTGSFRPSNNGNNFLSAASFTGVLDLASTTGVERVTGGLTLNGTINIGLDSVLAPQGNQTIGGSGTIVFADGSGTNRLNVEAGNLTLDSGITVRGQTGVIGQQAFAGGAASLTNNGTIAADVAGGTITLGVSGAVTNNGTLTALNGGTLVLNNSIVGNVGSQITVGAGSTIVQNGVTLNGVITNAGTGSFRPSNNNNNFLSAASFTGVLDLASTTGVERVAGGLTLNGTINIGLNSLLAPQGNQTIGGSGTIVFADGSVTNRLNVEAGSLTLGSGITVRGQTGVIGQQAFAGGAASLTNNGTLQADVAGGAVTIQVSGLTTNNGTLAALNGGTLNLNSAVQGNTGSQILAGAGSVVKQNGVTISGDMNLVGAGSFLPSNSGSNVLSGVTLAGTLDLATATGVERVAGGLTLSNAIINIGTGSVLAPQGNQTIAGTGTIVFADGSGGNRLNVEAGNLVLASGITVRGQTGIIGQQSFAGGAATLTNQGLISADTNGHSITVGVSGAVINQGTMRAQNGGLLQLNTGGGYDNSSGTLLADVGSTVRLNGAAVTGGLLNTNGTGVFKASASGSNFLNGVTLNGVLDLASAISIVRVTNGGMLLNGTINIGNSSVLAPAGNQTFSGTGTINFADASASNRLVVDAGNLVLGPGVTVHGQNGTIGTQVFAGGAATLTNNGTINADAGGTITVNIAGALTNNGTMRAQSGTLLIQDSLAGTGTLQVDPAGVMTLANLANTQGRLVMGAAGSTLNIGTQNLTINTDYTNAAAGSGNTFNRRAGISGTGQIIAGANAAQAITGATVSNGSTANATLTINNVRVGSTIYNYQVANTGTTGPSLRGAIQTSVNGGNLTDARLSGAGVTASNYNTGAPGGNTGNLGVTFTAATAGALAPLAGQVLNLRSNFENIADQKLNIVLAGGAAAFNAAVGLTTPDPVTVANQRIGGNNLGALAVKNNAAPGGFSEDLRATFGSNTGAATNNGGIVSALLAGSTDSSTMGVRVNTATAGAKTGSVTLNYQTTGTVNGVSNGLGLVGANAPQTITVSGNVYRIAQASPGTLPSVVNLGNFHAGAGAQSQTINITNTDAGAPTGFQEGLAAAILGTSGAGTGSGFANATVGNSGALVVGLSGIAAGANTGGVQVQLRSNGTTTTGSNGLGNFDLGASQTVTVNGTGWRLAQANSIAPINFGNVLVNTTQERFLTLSNTALADGFSEALNAAFGTKGGTNPTLFTTSGSISGLLAGAPADSTSMKVTLNTSGTGTVSANVQILLDSNGTAVGNGLGLTPLSTQTINLDGVITGVVGNLATAGMSPTSVNFGKFREGAANQTQQLTITNLSAGPGEGLNASFGTATGVTNNGASITSLAPTLSSTAMSVTLGGLATAGAKSGTQVVNFASDGSFNNNTPTALASQAVTLNAEVYRLAQASVTPTLALAARRVGDSGSTGTLTIANGAAADGFSEGLRGTIGAAPAGFGVSGPATTTLIGAGGNATRTVTLNTGTAGVFGGNINVALSSDGAGTSGFTELALPGQSTAVSGKVYNPAVGQLATTLVDFGVVRVGDAVSPRNVTVNNAATSSALDDTLRASLIGVGGPFSAAASVGGIAAGGSGAFAVGLSTTTAGAYNQDGSVRFLSQNADMGDISAGADAGVKLLATINNLANADFDFLTGLGLLTQSGTDYLLNLGDVLLGNNILTSLRLDNDVAGPADVLSGLFDLLTNADDFTYTGWAQVNGLAAGQATGQLDVGFQALALGRFEDVIAFNGVGTNASDPIGLAQSRRLVIRANVVDAGGTVPEPGTLGLMLLAAAAAFVGRRQRRAAR